MASNRAMTPSRRPRPGRWLGLALAVLLGAVATAPAQEGPRAPKAREILKTAIDTYKREDYEVASYLFAQAQERRNELEANERRDLDNFGVQNRMAMKSRQEGADQLRQADEALKHGRSAEAAALLKALTVNRYLSPGDCQLRATLTARLQAAGSAPAQPIAKGDAKALLGAARAALQDGKFDQAELLANEAEKAGATSSWLQPWADSAAKVRGDIARERAKAGPAKTELVPAEPPTPMTTSPYSPRVAQGPLNLPPAPVITPPAKQPTAGPDAPRPVQTPPPAAKPNVGVPDELIIARKMMADGYKALQAGDLETARRMAHHVRLMHVELGAKEMGPDQLLQEVQKKTQAIATPSAAKAPPASTAAAAVAPPPPRQATAPTQPPVKVTPAEARVMLKQARGLLTQRKIDDAEKLCNQAAAVPNMRWGMSLFEDTPESLRRDIQRARTQRDREEADRLLVEARKHFTKGQYEDAKKKAWRAQELHGDYGLLDFGDRPQRLLAEVARAEAAQGAQARKSDEKPRPILPPGSQLADNKSPYAPSTNTPRGRAVVLIAEAHELERRGMIVEAHQKVLEAKKLNVVFAPGDPDAPDAMLLTLAARCKGQVDTTLARVTEAVSAKPGDVTLLQQAQAELANARQLALSFGLDTVPVEQKAAWVQTAALSAAPGAMSQLPGLPPINPVQFQGNPVADGKRKEALDKLDLARLELRRANCKLARRLAEEAFMVGGAEQEATVVLRDIDAEEHNQRVLTAKRTFDAGADAYRQGQFAQAVSIMGAVDLLLLPAQQQARLREIMASPEMQMPTGRSEKVLLTAGMSDKGAPGSAVAGDMGDDPLVNVKAMEQIQLQQMQARNAQAQKSALDLFKLGQKMKAVELLTDQLSQIELGGLSPDATRQLRSPIEKRLSEFRMVMAQDLLSDSKRMGDSKLWDEGKFQRDLRKRQDEVADILKQCQALNRDGKFKDSLALAYKAHELDPDNMAANMAIQMLNIRMNQERSNKVKGDVERYFEEELSDFSPGMRPTDEKPIRMTEAALKRFANRKPGTAIFQQRSNPKERAIEYRLEQPIQFGFRDTPLKEVINTLSALSGVPVFADEKALREANIAMDQPLDMDCNGLSMKSGLKILLDKIGLTYVVRDEALLITTSDKARQNFRRAVYPVADLIVPIEDHPLPDVFDLQKVLERHSASQYALMNYMGNSPMTNLQMGLPPAPNVASYSGGLGSAFGTASQSPSQAQPYSPPQPSIKRNTIESLLMDLIKSTIQPNSWKDMGGPGTIQYYPMGMALVINQTQEVQGDVEELLKALRRLLDMEVAIEMRLVLVSESFYERIGVDFDVNLRTPLNPAAENQLLNQSFAPFGVVNRNLNFNNLMVGLTPAGTLTPDLNFPIKNSSFNFSVPPFGGYTAPTTDGGLSLGLAFLSEIQVFMILEAAQGDSRTNIMMAPKITVFNGQNAFLNVSVTQFINMGITAFPINGQLLYIPQNTPVPTGTFLIVTPVVSADRRFVRLNMVPNISNFVDGNVIPLFPQQIPIPNTVDGPIGLGVPAGQPIIMNSFQIQQPRISTISLNTTVNVPDGGTVLLGGLKVMSEGRNEAGPPVLSKIPYLDRLFRNVGWGRDAQSLMIMVTPRIIINEEEEQIFLGNIAPIPRP